MFPDFVIIEDYEDRARGYGVTWWEVVRLTVTQIPGAVMGVVVENALASGIRWARNRFKSERGKYGRFRPKCVIIQNPDGTEIATAVLISPRHKPISAQELMDRTYNPKPKRRKNKAKQGKKGKQEKQYKKRKKKKKGRK